MSALLYGGLTAKREVTPGDTTSDVAPGFKTYVDAYAALVPAEVLAAAIALTPVSSNSTRSTDKTTVVTVNNGDLKLTFWVLVLLGPVLYVIGHTKGFRERSTFTPADVFRMAIPGLAFIGWAAALHPSTLFDTAISISDSKKALLIVVGAIVLGAAASALGVRADRQTRRPAAHEPSPKKSPKHAARG